ncbi:MAG: AP endonuclease [Treponema sp.]|jgi:hypothetical protein|nr:AP endonuclease [Treponema sp.]
MGYTVPSWVIPGTYLENLRFLEDKSFIQGVEFLFFIYDDNVQSLLDREWAEIQRYRRRFTFTVHLPDVLSKTHENLIVQLLPLIRHYILHPGPPENREAQARLMGSWFERFGIHRFLVENTVPGGLEALLPYMPPETPLCMDTGHLLLEGKNPAHFFKRYRNRIQEIHLHDIDREKAAADSRLPDHRSLCKNAFWFQELALELVNFSGIINLEVFSWEEVCTSIAVMES